MNYPPVSDGPPQKSNTSQSGPVKNEFSDGLQRIALERVRPVYVGFNECPVHRAECRLDPPRSIPSCPVR